MFSIFENYYTLTTLETAFQLPIVIVPLENFARIARGMRKDDECLIKSWWFSPLERCALNYFGSVHFNSVI